MKKIALCLLLTMPFLIIGCELNPVGQRWRPTEPNQSWNNDFVTALNKYLVHQQIRYHCLQNGFEYKINVFGNSTPSPSPSPSPSPKFSDDVGVEQVFSRPTPTPWTKGNDLFPPIPIQGSCETGTTATNTSREKGRKEAELVRNEFIEQAITIIDSNYAIFTSDLQLGRASGNFLADTLEIAISGTVSGLQGPAETQRVLGVVLNSFKGIRSSFDLNFFDKQATAILINQMEINRFRRYAVIVQKKERSTDKYSLQEAIKDVVAYYNEGTLVRALTALSQQTGANARAQEDVLFGLQGVLPPEPKTNPNIIDTLLVTQSNEIIQTLTKDIAKGTKELKPPEFLAAKKKIENIFSALNNNKIFKRYTNFQDYKENIDSLKKIRSEVYSDEQFKLYNEINEAIFKNG